MKKIISTMLVVIILFNFILCNSSYATEDSSMFQGINSIQTNTITSESQKSYMDESKTKDSAGESGTETETQIEWGSLGDIFATIGGILVIVIDIFPMLIQVAMMIACNQKIPFTIENAVFNKIPLFDVDYFNFDDTYTIGNNHQTTITASETTKSLKDSVAKFFIFMRLIAIAISLLILIYVGIRMAISTIASDKAKYKEMLIGWVESIVLLFVMQYIISLIIGISHIFQNILYDIKMTIDPSETMSFETKILDEVYASIVGNAGWGCVLYSIIFWFLIFIQTKFFFSYMKRVISVGFLILIAPLVTITYPIDKIGDGKAQAFSAWFNELSMNIFIQPIHALIYLVFMYTAGEIAQYSSLIALFFLLSLTKVEKMILHLFNLRNVVSLKPVEDERKKGE